MKLLFIRHGEPDYSIDSLTEKGWREAEYLSERISKLDIKDIYCSPLGRAKDTARDTLKKLGREAIICDWLREVSVSVRKPGTFRKSGCAWDWYPAEWTKDERFFDKDEWVNNPVMADGNVGDYCKMVTDNFDKLLAEHGYVRDGYLYKVEKPNDDLLVFFCHFGLECVLMSHILHLPLMSLWHGFCASPTSVSLVVTEERTEGIASFRARYMGDISHLYVKGEEPSKMALFRESSLEKEEKY